MSQKFGFNRMQQEFQKSIQKNQKLIFNELTPEERAELLRRKAERKKQIDDLQQQQKDREKALEILNKREQENQKKEEGFQQDDINDEIAMKLHKQKIEQLKKEDLADKIQPIEEEKEVIVLYPKKVLNAFEVEFAKENNIPFDFLRNENLRIEAIAKSKIMEKIENFNKEIQNAILKVGGETQFDRYGKNKNLKEFEEIYLQKNMNQKQKQKARQTALSSIVNDNLGSIERNFSETVERRVAQIQIAQQKHGVSKDQIKSQTRAQFAREEAIIKKEERSSGESSYDSLASRINFWKDINTKDHNYRNAVIVSKSNKKQQNQMKLRNQRKTPTRKQPGKHNAKFLNGLDAENLENLDNYSLDDTHSRKSLPTKAKNNQPVVQVIAIKSYENKINSLQQQLKKVNFKHEQEKKQIKQTAMNYAIIYYKNKSQELTSIFTNEGIKLLEKYTYLRRHLLERDEMLMLAARRSVSQEEIIFELRQFLQKNIKSLMQEQEDDVGTGQIAYKREDEKEPFDKFGLYVASAQKQTSKSNLEYFQTMNQQLADDNKNLQGLLKTTQIADSIYKDDLNRLNKLILDLQCKNDNLNLENIYLKKNFEQQIQQLKTNCENKIKESEIIVEKTKQISAVESDLNQAIIKQFQADVAYLSDLLKKIRKLLKVPRLYRIFRELMDDIELAEQKHVNQIQNMMKQNKNNLEDEEKEAVLQALKFQFQEEFQVHKMQQRILGNIEQIGEINRYPDNFQINDFIKQNNHLLQKQNEQNSILSDFHKTEIQNDSQSFQTNTDEIFSQIKSSKGDPIKIDFQNDIRSLKKDINESIFQHEEKQISKVIQHNQTYRIQDYKLNDNLNYKEIKIYNANTMFQNTPQMSPAVSPPQSKEMHIRNQNLSFNGKKLKNPVLYDLKTENNSQTLDDSNLKMSYISEKTNLKNTFSTRGNQIYYQNQQLDDNQYQQGCILVNNKQIRNNKPRNQSRNPQIFSPMNNNKIIYPSQFHQKKQIKIVSTSLENPNIQNTQAVAFRKSKFYQINQEDKGLENSVVNQLTLSRKSNAERINKKKNSDISQLFEESNQTCNEENNNLLTIKEKNLVENCKKRIEIFRFKKEISMTHQNSQDKFFMIDNDQNEELNEDLNMKKAFPLPQKQIQVQNNISNSIIFSSPQNKATLKIKKEKIQSQNNQISKDPLNNDNIQINYIGNKKQKFDQSLSSWGNFQGNHETEMYLSSGVIKKPLKNNTGQIQNFNFQFQNKTIQSNSKNIETFYSIKKNEDQNSKPNGAFSQLYSSDQSYIIEQEMKSPMRKIQVNIEDVQNVDIPRKIKTSQMIQRKNNM